MSGDCEIDASGLETRALNDRMRDCMNAGVDKFRLKNVCGQRYIGTRLYSKEGKNVEIDIEGTPGSDLGVFLFGHKIRVHGNVQDGVGNTMDGGEIAVEGRAGDVLGMSMRGGKIFVRDSVGYRTALHMKEYEDKRPVIVIGGTSQDFLGEYMAGGMVILLGLGIAAHKGNFMGTGIHGGVIYIRGHVEESQLGNGVKATPVDEADRVIIGDCVDEFLQRFPEVCASREEIMEGDFVKLLPKSKRPYQALYA